VKKRRRRFPGKDGASTILFWSTTPKRGGTAVLPLTLPPGGRDLDIWRGGGESLYSGKSLALTSCQQLGSWVVPRPVRLIRRKEENKPATADIIHLRKGPQVGGRGSPSRTKVKNHGETTSRIWPYGVKLVGGLGKVKEPLKSGREQDLADKKREAFTHVFSVVSISGGKRTNYAPEEQGRVSHFPSGKLFPPTLKRGKGMPLGEGAGSTSVMTGAPVSRVNLPCKGQKGRALQHLAWGA